MYPFGTLQPIETKILKFRAILCNSQLVIYPGFECVGNLEQLSNPGEQQR
jgi:hypothetical protein